MVTLLIYAAPPLVGIALLIRAFDRHCQRAIDRHIEAALDADWLYVSDPRDEWEMPDDRLLPWRDPAITLVPRPRMPLDDTIQHR